MKTILLIASISLFFMSCKSNNDNRLEDSEAAIDSLALETNYIPFGEEITLDMAITNDKMAILYQNMNVTDSLNVKFTAPVSSVCQAKGCWMKLDLGDSTETMVKFKDYAFFVPKNIAGQEVTVEGKAFIRELSVDEQKHYLEDAGKNEDEIAKITEPKRILSFEAVGVLLKE